MKNSFMLKSTAIIFMASSLSACNIFTRIANIGSEPPLNPIENPVEAKGYQPVSMPMPEEKQVAYAPNSLWQKGSAGFFKDQRAAKIGDILTVKILAKDAAVMESETEQNRDNNKDSLGIGALFGFESYTNKVLPGAAVPNNLVNVTSNREISGDGKIDRQETIDMTMAATVTQVLPNGNLVVEGTQEIRVNFEVRQLYVRGIVRRADISSDNTVVSDKIAELRVSYGGKGIISDVQQPRYGSQLLDIVSPF